MLAPQEAQRLIETNLPSWPGERVSLADALGRVLGEKIPGERPLPPFDRVAMDGVALRHQALQAGKRRFHKKGMIPAGSEPMTLEEDSDCLEVMTGAVLPPGADCVIPVEQLEVNGNDILLDPKLDLKIYPKWKNVHRAGSDHPAGAPLAQPGAILGPPEMALLASEGWAKVTVSQALHGVIVTTGDELVPLTGQPEPYQIRRTNDFLLRAMLERQIPGKVTCVHASDREEELHQVLATALTDADYLVTTGGVSMGKYDAIPGVLANLGVRKVFHKVSQKPGKPLYFGCHSSGTPCFGLPGNPVSALVCAARYVIPGLRTKLGYPQDTGVRSARITQSYQPKERLSLLVPVNLKQEGSGQMVATPIRYNGSGDFASLVGATGCLEISPGREILPTGTRFPLYPF